MKQGIIAAIVTILVAGAAVALVPRFLGHGTDDLVDEYCSQIDRALDVRDRINEELDTDADAERSLAPIQHEMERLEGSIEDADIERIGSGKHASRWVAEARQILAGESDDALSRRFNLDPSQKASTALSLIQPDVAKLECVPRE